MNILSMFNCRIGAKPALLSSLLALALMGCAPDPDAGDKLTTIALPTDTSLKLQCPDAGIYRETCVLADPDNPYATIDITDITKFELNDGTPSAKARYYLWASALARRSSGENQYYLARALHELFTAGGSELARSQAIRAYRSVLDNYFGTVTYFGPFTVQGQEVYTPASLNSLTGALLHQPTGGFNPLFADPALAIDAMSSWGYIYDPATQEVVPIVF